MTQPLFVSKQSLISIFLKFVFAPISFLFVIYVMLSAISASVGVIVLAFVIIIILTLIAIGFNVSKVEIGETSIKSISIFREVSIDISDVISMAVVDTALNTGLNYQLKTKDKTITFDIPSNWKEFEEYIINKADLELENTAVVLVVGDYPKVRRWKKRGMEYVNTGIRDSFMGLNYLGGRGSKWKFLFVLTIFIIFVIFVVYVKVLTPLKPIEVKQNIVVKTVGECSNDTECATNEFCDISRPGGMTPYGYESGEPYGSRKCIRICKSNSDCSSNQCKNYPIVGGDLVINKMGCASK